MEHPPPPSGPSGFPPLCSWPKMLMWSDSKRGSQARRAHGVSTTPTHGSAGTPSTCVPGCNPRRDKEQQHQDRSCATSASTSTPREEVPQDRRWDRAQIPGWEIEVRPDQERRISSPCRGLQNGVPQFRVLLGAAAHPSHTVPAPPQTDPVAMRTCMNLAESQRPQASRSTSHILQAARLGSGPTQGGWLALQLWRTSPSIHAQCRWYW